jgi:hypothetical protein
VAAFFLEILAFPPKDRMTQFCFIAEMLSISTGLLLFFVQTLATFEEGMSRLDLVSSVIATAAVLMYVGVSIMLMMFALSATKASASVKHIFALSEGIVAPVVGFVYATHLAIAAFALNALNAVGGALGAPHSAQQARERARPPRTEQQRQRRREEREHDRGRAQQHLAPRVDVPERGVGAHCAGARHGAARGARGEAEQDVAKRVEVIAPAQRLPPVHLRPQWSEGSAVGEASGGGVSAVAGRICARRAGAIGRPTVRARWRVGRARAAGRTKVLLYSAVPSRVLEPGT